jgi:hypothetical protein
VQRWRILVLAAALLAATDPAAAQEPEPLPLSIGRDFGFASGGRIQGTFSLRVSGPDDLVRVEFLIDGQVVNLDEEPPFRYQFNTGSHALGTHTLAAVGTTADGRRLSSRIHTVEVVSAEEGVRVAGSIVLPLLVVIGGFTLLGVLLPALLDRGGGRAGSYGLAGVAVCRRCRLPFGRRLLAPNLLAGKLARCPHCGRWQIARRASRASLESAQARLAAQAGLGVMQVEDEAGRLRRRIEDSRFEDG